MFRYAKLDTTFCLVEYTTSQPAAGARTETSDVGKSYQPAKLFVSSYETSKVWTGWHRIRDDLRELRGDLGSVRTDDILSEYS